jgi:hypothetical protein
VGLLLTTSVMLMRSCEPSTEQQQAAGVTGDTAALK